MTPTAPTPTRCWAITTVTRNRSPSRNRNYLFTNTEWFFQDDWKVKSNLSISWGVRFYHDPPQYDARQSFRPSRPRHGIRRTAPVLIRPAVVNGVNVGIDPTTGTIYGQGQVGLISCPESAIRRTGW